MNPSEPGEQQSAKAEALFLNAEFRSALRAGERAVRRAGSLQLGLCACLVRGSNVIFQGQFGPEPEKMILMLFSCNKLQTMQIKIELEQKHENNSRF